MQSSWLGSTHFTPTITPHSILCRSSSSPLPPTCPSFTCFIRGLFRPINHCDDRCQYRQTPPQPSSLTILTPGHRRRLLTWVVGPLPWISTVFTIPRHPFGASRSPTIVGCVLFKYFAMWACCLPYICTGTPCYGPDRGCGP